VLTSAGLWAMRRKRLQLRRVEGVATDRHKRCFEPTGTPNLCQAQRQQLSKRQETASRDRRPQVDGVATSFSFRRRWRTSNSTHVHSARWALLDSNATFPHNGRIVCCRRICAFALFGFECLHRALKRDVGRFTRGRARDECASSTRRHRLVWSSSRLPRHVWHPSQLPKGPNHSAR